MFKDGQATDGVCIIIRRQLLFSVGHFHPGIVIFGWGDIPSNDHGGILIKEQMRNATTQHDEVLCDFRSPSAWLRINVLEIPETQHNEEPLH